jgi:hypothetical protein
MAPTWLPWPYGKYVGKYAILRYPLVNYQLANWKITIFKNGKSKINGPFPIAMLNYQRVNYQKVITRG